MKRMIFIVSHNKVLCIFLDEVFSDEFKSKKPMKIFVIFCPKIGNKMLKV